MDVSAVPLFALSIETKQLISALLNPPKILPTDDGLPRDWRGLAHTLGIPGEMLPLLSSHTDPSNRILGSIQEKKSNKITMKNLQEALEKIERWDIIDDVETLLEKDAQEYFVRIERSQLSAEAVDDNVDLQMLTVDDLYRFRAGLEKQCYDAFLLYADEDNEFAMEMIDRLEKENLKLCTKDRDLIAGVTFEHEAIMELISERCNRLIVIISPNFLKSPANNFFLTYAHAVGIDKQQRKLIPCIYKDCKLPPQLSYTNKMNYNRRGMFDFWGRLCDSVRTPTTLKPKVNTNLSSSCSNSNNVKEAVNTISTKICDTKNLSEKNKNDSEVLKENENSEVVKEPNLSECARVSTKTHVVLSNRGKNKTKKGDTLENYEEISDEQVSDCSFNLPSIPAVDDEDLLPTRSDSGKKKKSKFMKTCIKKVQSVLKS